MPQVYAEINKGKDFTLHTLEINAIAEPGSYVAFSAMPNDLYSRGMNDGLNENTACTAVLLSQYMGPGLGKQS